MFFPLSSSISIFILLFFQSSVDVERRVRVLEERVEINEVRVRIWERRERIRGA